MISVILFVTLGLVLLIDEPAHSFTITSGILIRPLNRNVNQGTRYICNRHPGLVAYQSIKTETDDVASLSKFKKLDEIKSRLVRLCNEATTETKSKAPSLLQQRIFDAVEELEDTFRSVDDVAEYNDNLYAIYDWMNGEWELLYTPVDNTRSSPFFWAFRQAFPDQSDQIYSITDAIPSPIKDIGPAFQEINCQYNRNAVPISCTGTLVSRVRVATLSGMASSIMTTRTSIIGTNDSYNTNELRLKIETTKPEQSTIIQKIFGPTVGTYMNDVVLPPFPSGTVLEQVTPGASEVLLTTSFCDATLRITKNKYNEYFIWKRKSFSTGETL